MGWTPIFLQFLYLSIQDLNFRERSGFYKAWDMTRHSQRDAQASGTPEVSHRDVPPLLLLLLDERRWPLPFIMSFVMLSRCVPPPPTCSDHHGNKPVQYSCTALLSDDCESWAPGGPEVSFLDLASLSRSKPQSCVRSIPGVGIGLVLFASSSPQNSKQPIL